MLRTHQFKNWVLLVCAVSALLISLSLDRIKPNEERFLSKYQHEIESKLREFHQTLDRYLSDSMLVSGIAVQQSGLRKNIESSDYPFTILVYDGDSLIYWNNNRVMPKSLAQLPDDSSNVVYLSNGYYKLLRRNHLFAGLLASNGRSGEASGDSNHVIKDSDAQGNFTVIGLIPISKGYPIKNKFLITGLDEIYDIPQELNITVIEGESEYDIKGENGEYLCSVKTDSVPVRSNRFELLAIIGYILTFLFLFAFLHFQVGVLLDRGWGWAGFTIWVGLVVLMRYLMAKNHFPDALYSTLMFDPKLYASSNWLHSLGDLLMNSVIIFWWIFFFSINSKKFLKIPFGGDKKVAWVIIFISILLVFHTAVNLAEIIKGLVLNSHIPFNIHNFFSLNVYSFIGIFIIGILLISYYMIAEKLFNWIRQLKIYWPELLTIALAATTVYVLLSVLLGGIRFLPKPDWLVLIWTGLFIIYLIRFASLNSGFITIIGLILYFSIFTSLLLDSSNKISELQTRKTLAKHLAEDSDPIAEFILPSVQEKIANDKFIQNYMINPLIPRKHFIERIQQLYFSGYLNKYDVSINLLYTSGNLINETIGNIPEYQVAIRADTTKSLIEKGLYKVVTSKADHSGYELTIPIFFSTRELGRIKINLVQKILHKHNVYPELLLDEKVKTHPQIEDYSYAIYKDNFLVESKGRYAFSYALPYDTELHGDFLLVQEPDAVNLIYKKDDQKIVVISKVTQSGFLGFITVVSYLFCFVLILFLLGIFLNYLAANIASRLFNIKLSHGYLIMFRTRTQIAMIGLILLSFVVVGWGTFINFTTEYNKYNTERLARKVNQVTSALKYEISPLTQTGLTTDNTSSVVLKLSDIHSIDLNIYDLHGQLIASSQPDIFSKGLSSRKINPTAFIEINNANKTKFIHNEKIGKLEYLAAYVPVLDKKGTVFAIVNLPYYAKEKDLQSEISSLMVNLINIYGLLFVLGSFLALFLAYPITSSITLIIEKIKKTNIGTTNEPIEWSRKDEFGLLVNEYNKMLKALDESTKKLARSERESAWREMAKQVAHEIKNPLTPMKLSIQQLQRAFKSNRPDLDKLVDKVSATLVEQIDNLSHIASAFSDFAKMPKADNEVFNIGMILKKAVDLYQESGGVEVSFIDEAGTEPEVFSDKNQISRVFTNLIQNSLQSIQENRDGVIKVSLKTKDDDVIVSISDNGAGISEAISTRVFEPNFTTKSSGMGLGLAMARNIIENANGTIWFESEVNVGTTFFIRLPLRKKD